MSSKIWTASYAVLSTTMVVVVSALTGFIVLPEFGRTIAYIHSVVMSVGSSTEYEPIKLSVMFVAFLLWVSHAAFQVWVRGRKHYDQTILQILFACCGILIMALVLSPSLPLEVVLGIMVVCGSILKYYSVE